MSIVRVLKGDFEYFIEYLFSTTMSVGVTK